MANMYDNYEVDEALAQNGIWVDYEDSEFKVLIANFGESNKESQVSLVRERKAAGIRDGGDAASEKLDKMIIGVMSNCLIKDWQIKEKGKWVQGIHGSKGERLPFTPENVRNVLRDFPIIKNGLFKDCNDHNLYLKKEAEEIAKN